MKGKLGNEIRVGDIVAWLEAEVSYGIHRIAKVVALKPINRLALLWADADYIETEDGELRADEIVVCKTPDQEPSNKPDTCVHVEKEEWSKLIISHMQDPLNSLKNLDEIVAHKPAEPNSVWVVTNCGCSDDWSIEAIFASEEAAEKYIQEKSESMYVGLCINLWDVQE
jgi:hypothetical protein